MTLSVETLCSVLFLVVLSFFGHFIFNTACANGDGIGEREQIVGKAADMDDCITKVKNLFPFANGATFKEPCDPNETSGCKCYAEINMTDWNDSKMWRACRIAPKIKLDKSNIKLGYLRVISMR